MQAKESFIGLNIFIQEILNNIIYSKKESDWGSEWKHITDIGAVICDFHQ